MPFKQQTLVSFANGVNSTQAEFKTQIHVLFRLSKIVSLRVCHQMLIKQTHFALLDLPCYSVASVVC